MNDSRSLLIRSVMSAMSPRSTASRSRSIKGSTIGASVFITILPSILLQISVSREPLLVAPQELLGLLEAHALGPQGALRRPAHPRHQVVAVVAHVAQHVGDRIAAHHALDLVVLLGIERHVDGVGVAEEVVEIAQDLLISADQK